MLPLVAMMIVALLGFAGLVIDGGNFYAERRQAQNAADEAALAAAYEMSYGGSDADAVAAALENATANGYDNDGMSNTVIVNIPPTSGDFTGTPRFAEVMIDKDVPTFFIHVVVPDAGDVGARGVAGVLGEGEGEEGDPVDPVPVPVPAVPCASPTVDGRVMGSEGYTKIGDLAGGSTDYGDAFHACDDTYYYFALRLNGPTTGGAVANENVYGDKKDYHPVFETGWKKHTFGSLIGSDRARFQVSCDDDPLHDFIQDYLSGDDKKDKGWKSGATHGDGKIYTQGPAESSSSLAYNVTHPNETGWGDDPEEDPFKQSPPFNPTYPTFDSEYSGWVWEVIYEFSVPKASFSSCSGPIYFGVIPFEGQRGPVGGIHSSPAKEEGGGSVFLVPIDIRLVE